jgi:hypothetical protein
VPLSRFALAFSLALALALPLAPGLDAKRRVDCSLTETGQVPLSDLPGTYRGVEAGLYPNGSTVRPASHEATGLELAQHQIRPLDPNGAPNATTGRIGLVSLGMSNTSTEFGRFLELVATDPMLNPRLTVVNGALANQTADRWLDPSSTAWLWMLDQVARSGLTRNQVQVAWVKVVRPGFGSNTTDPLANFPSFPIVLQSDLETISRNLKIRFPNIRIAYFSSRIRAYITPRGLSPEPTAYETAFAVKWAIGDQIRGLPGLAPEVAPWMSWGPYLWADGLSPRSDGLTYECADLESDFIHPAVGAAVKVANQLRAFFATDPTATPWFLKAPIGPPSIGSVTATPATGTPGTRVAFAATATDPDGVREFVWTFGDGTFAYGPAPTKTFAVTGRYPVRLTVFDRAGNAATATVAIDIGGAPTNLPGTVRNLRVIIRPPGGL